MVYASWKNRALHHRARVLVVGLALDLVLHPTAEPLLVVLHTSTCESTSRQIDCIHVGDADSTIAIIIHMTHEIKRLFCTSKAPATMIFMSSTNSQVYTCLDIVVC